MTTERHGLWFHLFDVILNIVIIVAIVAAIRTFLISPFQVEGNSMVDTLEHKEYIIINKLAYRIGDPERGDIVVFRPPNTPRKPYVKRIIGLPGDEVVITGGKVFVKTPEADRALTLEESYLNAQNAGRTYKAPPSSGDTSEIRYHVPDDHYFLLGDNRQGSLDSRSFRGSEGEILPFIHKKSLLGRVWFIALPISKIHAFEPPEYGL